MAEATKTEPVSNQMPPGIPYIIGNEAAERFSYYGMNSILVPFMTHYLLTSSGAKDFMTPEQAGKISPETVTELAEHAQKQSPSIVEQASAFYAQHPTLVKALGAGSLALIMSHLSRKT